jgi:hypothetical protein
VFFEVLDSPFQLNSSTGIHSLENRWDRRAKKPFPTCVDVSKSDKLSLRENFVTWW